jgi:hypothetical protein
MQQQNDIPTKRIQVYDRLGLNRLEGSKLSEILGLPKREPLSQSDIESLSRLSNSFKQWKLKGHSINTFCEHYRSN